MAAISLALTLGLDSIDHRRANRLHREGVAQALRIHEATSIAAQEYHRKVVKLRNAQHERKTLQERYQHEEDIDLEKRVATRDNIRDDWHHFGARAETVLLVNTLLLG